MTEQELIDRTGAELVNRAVIIDQASEDARGKLPVFDPLWKAPISLDVIVAREQDTHVMNHRG